MIPAGSVPTGPIPVGLVATVREAWGIGIDDAHEIVGGGDACVIWHVTAPSPYVIRISPVSATATELAWAFDVAATFATEIPDVVAPIPTRTGAHLVDWSGSPVSLWPYVDGTTADRDDPAIRAQAADLLARLHLAGRRIPDPGPRPDPLPHVIHPDADLLDAALDEALATWRRNAAGEWPRGAVHGDFYRRNLLVRAEGIAGLIDWDEARYDWLVTEVAWAAWEFGKAPSGDDLIVERAEEFLGTYARSGGPAYPGDLIVPLIRERLRDEIGRARAAMEPYDADYVGAQIRAFRRLGSQRS